MTHVLVTGGAGFIYSTVARHLVHLGHDVTIADHFDVQGKGRNIADLLPHVRLLIGCLATGALAHRCAEVQPDALIHAAAYTHVDDAITNPETFVVNNMVSTTRLLQAVVTSGHVPQTILVVSTDEVFGPTPRGEAFDEQAPYNPSNAYSASKVGVEAVARAFVVTHGLPIVVVRSCNVYGPAQHPSKAIPRFVQQLLAGRDMTLYNDGRGARDWLHVDDHARAIACLLERGVPGESYNLAADEEHSDLDLATRIYQELVAAQVVTPQRTVPWTLTPGRPGHDRRYRMDGRKLRALGWQPLVDFDAGLRDTVRWNAQHPDWWASDTVRLEAA